MRTSGILMPIFSLSSPYGIGTLGKEAHDFVDFLKLAGQTYWQILPIGPTGFGDSPYQPFSAFAGNPYFVDFRILESQGLLEKNDFCNEDFGTCATKIDYGKQYENRYRVLRKAFVNFKKTENPKFLQFCTENRDWLQDYAVFTAIKNTYGGDLQHFPPEIKQRKSATMQKLEAELAEEIEFTKVIQYWFFEQWFKIKKYANKNGIKIIGDIPIYVSKDSADLWANPKEFQLDEDYNPTFVAGCPPDAFSANGQLWGNPLYDWDKMKNDGFSWWCRRMAHSAKLYDTVRIDHFRGFDEYFSIKADAKNAKNGEWRKGPRTALFDSFKNNLGNLNIIAEDLGTLTDTVDALLKATGYPGMAVLQFAFDPNTESRYLPHNIEKNCVVYTGTHDNDTIVGYAQNLDKNSLEFCRNYLRYNVSEGYNWAMIKSALASPADTCILLMQDFMGLGSEARINTPSTTENNWQWRIEGSCINSWLAEIIYKSTKLYFRLPKVIKNS